MYLFLFLTLFNITHAFNMHMKTPSSWSTNWDTLRFSIKENARNWFVSKAIRSGIPWNELYVENVEVHDKINEYKEQIEEKNIIYPDYYLRPFHGYDEGNMIWKAAHEAEAATLSISIGYWDNTDPYVAQEYMRNNITNNIKQYLDNLNMKLPNNILDVGCSIGVSTEYLYKNFETSENIHGIDLSPYFIGMAEYRKNVQNTNIQYSHGNAENMPYENDKFDLIVCNFLFHELPREAANNIIKEIYNKLSYNGVIAIVDMDPSHLDKQLKGNVFRKWAFESTEPHIYNYYLRNTNEMLESHGFEYIEKRRSDPLNSIWLGSKKSYLQSGNINKNVNIKNNENDKDIMFKMKKLASI